MITKRRIRRALDKLGETPDQVAVSLEYLKIKGLQGKAESCPIAVYLRSKFGKTSSVGHLQSTIYPKASFYNKGKTCSNPIPVQEFISKFDHGVYPQLYGPNTNY